MNSVVKTLFFIVLPAASMSPEFYGYASSDAKPPLPSLKDIREESKRLGLLKGEPTGAGSFTLGPPQPVKPAVWDPLSFVDKKPDPVEIIKEKAQASTGMNLNYGLDYSNPAHGLAYAGGVSKAYELNPRCPGSGYVPPYYGPFFSTPNPNDLFAPSLCNNRDAAFSQYNDARTANAMAAYYEASFNAAKAGALKDDNLIARENFLRKPLPDADKAEAATKALLNSLPLTL